MSTITRKDVQINAGADGHVYVMTFNTLKTTVKLT